LIFGFIDDKIGGKRTIAISLFFLTLSTAIGAVAQNRLWFWISACGIGFFVGPNQSASRSLMARLVPQKHESEFFGFFALSGKATAFVGPLLLGLLSDAYGQRVGVASVLLFFVVGGILLWRVDERKGIAVASGGFTT
jgi:UMF1 family MFS transporter